MSIDKHLRRSSGLLWVKLVLKPLRDYLQCGKHESLDPQGSTLFTFELLRQQPKSIQRESEKMVRSTSSNVSSNHRSIIAFNELPLIASRSGTLVHKNYVYMYMDNICWDTILMLAFYLPGTIVQIPSQGHKFALQNPVSSKSRSPTWPCWCSDLKEPGEIFQKPRR